MKKWEQILSCILAITVMTALSACGNKETENSEAAQTVESGETEADAEGNSETTEPEAAEPENAESKPEEAGDAKEAAGTESGKTLVVYYSASGHTGDVAGYIAAATGADTFELEPVEAYTSEDLNYSDEDSRVVYEHDNPDARAVELAAAAVPDWESYDTVFVGYPIWWGIAAWPVNQFIETNDFTGKTVIPFCTSASSGLGESGELLKEMAGTGDWLEGQRFQSGVSEEDVQAWVEGLEL